MPYKDMRESVGEDVETMGLDRCKLERKWRGNLGPRRLTSAVETLATTHTTNLKSVRSVGIGG